MRWTGIVLMILLVGSRAGLAHADELTQIVQQDLTSLGYDPGPVNGLPG